MTSNPFWIVFCPTGKEPPHKQHASEIAATIHAEELARCAGPNAIFYVMKCVGVAHTVRHVQFDSIG